MKRILLIVGILVIAFLVILAVIRGPQQTSKTDFISIGTGGTGGVYYPYGGGLANIWSKNIPGVKVVAEVTAGSVENVKLVDKGESDLGEIMGDVAYQAYHGEGKFKESGPQNILGLAVMYPSMLQVVTLQGSRIDRMGQISGKTVSIGAPGSGTALISETVLSALDIGKEMFKMRQLSFVENANALKDHTIDVGIWCAAAPTSSIMDLATTRDIKILSFTADEQKKICERYPFYSAHDLPANLYRGVDKAVATISVWNVIICKADLSDDLVYNLTKVLFENYDYMQQIHPFARFTTPENTVEHSPIPLHPGAIKYLKEKGLEVPSELYLVIPK